MYIALQRTEIFWVFIIVTHPSVFQELDFIIYTKGRGSWYFRSSSRGGLANFIPIAGMGHLISEPKFKIPTYPSPPRLLISDKSLRKSMKHSTNLSKKKKTKTTRITWRLSFVCLSCLFPFSLSRAHAYHAMHSSVTGFHYLPFSSKIFENMLHLSFSMKLTFSERKCH